MDVRGLEPLIPCLQRVMGRNTKCFVWCRLHKNQQDFRSFKCPKLYRAFDRPLANEEFGDRSLGDAAWQSDKAVSASTWEKADGRCLSGGGRWVREDHRIGSVVTGHTADQEWKIFCRELKCL